jgi:hypothetical protein
VYPPFLLSANNNQIIAFEFPENILRIDPKFSIKKPKGMTQKIANVINEAGSLKSILIIMFSIITKNNNKNNHRNDAGYINNISKNTGLQAMTVVQLLNMK